MEKSTAFANAMSVYMFAESKYPQYTKTMYQSPTYIEVTLHIDAHFVLAQICQEDIEDVIIPDARIKLETIDDGERHLLNIDYFID